MNVPRRARTLTRSAGLTALMALTAIACQPQPTTPGPAAPVVVAPTTAPTTPPSTTAPPTTTSAPPARATTWTLVGGDEFNASTLDLTRWKPYHSAYGSGNQQLECNRPDNVRLTGGSLRITAQRQTVTCPGVTQPMGYTAGFLGSRETGTYYPRFARFEIRARIPHAQGLWPAFWLRHRQGSAVAEVDIMESFHSQVPGRVTQTVHLNRVSNVSKRTTFLETPTATPAWHTYAVDIEPDPGGVRFTFSIDGTTTHTYVDPDPAWADAAPADATWDIAINLAVGGRWVGHPDGHLGYLDLLDRCSIAGTPPACTTTGIRRVDWADTAASTYEVDWIRVYERPTR